MKVCFMMFDLSHWFNSWQTLRILHRNNCCTTPRPAARCKSPLSIGMGSMQGGQHLSIHENLLVLSKQVNFQCKHYLKEVLCNVKKSMCVRNGV
mmetsp:Transcript_47229/g.84505  ORF Transcript_47229/g.84505 Transcript_47229/m.84505 type:complete len:94 (+) Transcript_47229:1651-1932(+)